MCVLAGMVEGEEGDKNENGRKNEGGGHELEGTAADILCANSPVGRLWGVQEIRVGVRERMVVIVWGRHGWETGRERGRESYGCTETGEDMHD